MLNLLRFQQGTTYCWSNDLKIRGRSQWFSAWHICCFNSWKVINIRYHWVCQKLNWGALASRLPKREVPKEEELLQLTITFVGGVPKSGIHFRASEDYVLIFLQRQERKFTNSKIFIRRSIEIIRTRRIWNSWHVLILFEMSYEQLVWSSICLFCPKKLFSAFKTYTGIKVLVVKFQNVQWTSFLDICGTCVA